MVVFHGGFTVAESCVSSMFVVPELELVDASTKLYAVSYGIFPSQCLFVYRRLNKLSSPARPVVQAPEI